MKSIFAVCLVYLALAIPSTIVYSSVRDADGNFMSQSNIVSNMPSNTVWAVMINVLMWLSCMCSEPVLLSSTNELLEKNCRRSGLGVISRPGEEQQLPRERAEAVVGAPCSDCGIELHCVRPALLRQHCQFIYPLFALRLIPSLALGGFAFVATSILIPVIIHYSVYKSTMRNKEKLVHFLLGLAAFLLMVVATFFSVMKLINDILKN